MPDAAPGSGPNYQLSASFTALARAVAAERTASGLGIQHMVTIAASAVPHAYHVGLTTVGADGRLETVAETSTICRRLDDLQRAAGEGPCLDAPGTDDICRIDDLGGATPWPGFAALVLAHTPVRSMVAIRLHIAEQDHAALSFYAEDVDMFDDVDLGVAAMFSSYISLALHQQEATRKIANLEAALETSRHIGAAMGILMSREFMTFEQAFDRLRSASQRLHRKLRDVAAEVLDTGELPD